MLTCTISGFEVSDSAQTSLWAVNRAQHDLLIDFWIEEDYREYAVPTAVMAWTLWEQRRLWFVSMSCLCCCLQVCDSQRLFRVNATLKKGLKSLSCPLLFQLHVYRECEVNELHVVRITLLFWCSLLACELADLSLGHWRTVRELSSHIVYAFSPKMNINRSRLVVCPNTIYAIYLL